MIKNGCWQRMYCVNIIRTYHRSSGKKERKKEGSMWRGEKVKFRWGLSLRETFAFGFWEKLEIQQGEAMWAIEPESCEGRNRRVEWSSSMPFDRGRSWQWLQKLRRNGMAMRMKGREREMVRYECELCQGVSEPWMKKEEYLVFWRRRGMGEWRDCCHDLMLWLGCSMLYWPVCISLILVRRW